MLTTKRENTKTQEDATMTIKEAERTYRLPNPTTAEDLGCRWSHVLNYGDRVLLAG